MRSIVLVLTGNPASGKSTLAAKLSEKFGGLAVLKFDDYFDFLQGWPSDMRKWIENGANVSDWKNPKLTRDIKKLLKGKSIEHPKSKRIVEPSPIILLEDPSGRGREEIAKLVDYLIFLEIPNEVSLMRSLKRWLEAETKDKEGNKVRKRDEDPAELLDQMIAFVKKYVESYRDMYVLVCNQMKKDADLILDGTKPPEVLVSDVLLFLNGKRIELPEVVER